MDVLQIKEEKLSRNDALVVLFIYISVFINSYIFFREPFEFYFGYLIYIFLLPSFVSKYGLNRHLSYIFFILLITGVINIALGANTTALFIKVFTGLSLSYFFYYYVVVEFKYDVEKLFKWYLTGCYIASLLGVFQLVSFLVGFEAGTRFGGIFNKWGLTYGGWLGLRINSIFAEPTHLAAVLSAAFFVSVNNFLRKESYHLSKFKSAVVIAIYILSFSGLGQVGIFLALIMLLINYGLVRYLIVVAPLSIILFNVLYNNVPEFRERLDGLTSLNSGEEFQLGKTHGSSFILYNNYNVALKNFKTNFVFGSGIGSHPVAFEKYTMAKHIKTYGFNLNSADANSMFLRLLSETGLFGVSIFLFIVFKGYVKKVDGDESEYWLISNGILIMILLNLFRQGHYFLNGFPLFMFLYYYNKVNYQKYIETQTTSVKNDSPSPMAALSKVSEI